MRILENLPQHIQSSYIIDHEPEDWIEVDHFLQEDDKDFDYTPKPQQIRKKRRYTKRKNMHPLESGGVGVPAFLAKLWRLVEDPETNNLISWSQDGKSFLIQNQAKFAKELLPLNYKHNNMASFIRQLNMYGFHKITSIDNGGLKFDKDEMEFSHPYFQQGHPYLIEHIKRKITNPKQAEVDKGSASKTETMNRVLNEVKNMRGRQESLDSRFSTIKQENEALWREVAILRQKHMKQQQIVNKLIQFLVTLVNPQRSGLGSGIGKRRYPLMINDAPQSKVKRTNGGPIISELTEELLDDIEHEIDQDLMNTSANIQSPGSPSSSKGSKSSSGLEDLYFSLSNDNNSNMLKYAYGFNPFTNNDNIGTNYFADLTPSQVDLGLDDIDEIDTNNMAIYSGEPVKKNGTSGRGKELFETSSGFLKGKQQQQQQQPARTVIVPQKASQGKSLIKNESKDLPEINIDVANDNAGDDVLAQAVDAANISPVNSLAGQSMISNYDENSRHTDLLDDDELFGFDDKGIKKEEDTMSLTKYNPPCTDDITSLSSAHDFTNHINNVQNDLDSLKDLLHNDTYSLNTNEILENNQNNLMYGMPNFNYDADTITKLAEDDASLLKITQELFDDNMYEMSPSSMELFTGDGDKKGEGTSNSLIAYQPSPYNNNLDLNDLLSNVGNTESVEQEKA